MKHITIEVPRAGASVQFVLRAGAASGQAIIVASDEAEIRLAEPAPAAPASPKAPQTTNSGKAPARDLDTILKRLLKLKPTKRATAVNSIKAMFQFDSPITDEAANKILEDFRRRGSITIDANDKLRFCDV